MNSAVTESAPARDADAPHTNRAARLLEQIERAAHLLPAQGPITAFVHHNTLHAFEDLSFDEAVLKGAETFGCHPYLPEEAYREELVRGRIQQSDIEAVLVDDLGDRADELLGFFGTRYQLRLAMLAHPLRTGLAAELRWIVAETDALRTFRPETPAQVRDQTIADTRHWVMRDLKLDPSQFAHVGRVATILEAAFQRFGVADADHWSDPTWEAFTLNALWRLCRDGVARSRVAPAERRGALRHRDQLKELTGQDSDRPVNELLIRFCAAFLDQGLASWPLPDRELGFFRCFLNHHRGLGRDSQGLRNLGAEVDRLVSRSTTPVESIEESLADLGVEEGEREDYLAQTLLAMRGFAGMIWQLESRGDRAARPAAKGTLVEYLAIRLILERISQTNLAREACGFEQPLARLRDCLRELASARQPTGNVQRAFEVFQLAQVIGWRPSQLARMSDVEWGLLIRELGAFGGVQRRRVYQLAYERGYRTQALDAIAVHSRRVGVGARRAGEQERRSFQIVCCIDDREESLRRHLEEVDPRCETYGAAGFFAVAMYYRGAADAHFRPLCPVIITPEHYVVEHVAFTAERADRQRRRRRRVVGTVTHRAHVGSRTFAGGWLAAVLGSLASIPLVMRILFPRAAARARSVLGALVRAPSLTRLQIERRQASPGPENGQVGYDADEMAAIVERLLRDIALTAGFARLVIVCGHGSSSLNNPHEAAYDCGACSGGKGGPNARAFAQMANDPRVREQVAASGLRIPADTVFLGSYHNTCDDAIEFYDLELLPTTHRDDFRRAAGVIDEARRRNAHERCRRFESAALSISFDDALRHVEGRAEDLSQARPELGHATNALCLVGRREWSRGLFLDRRAFLQSYDPSQDDEDLTLLTRILQAVIPVCAGINLEYYFSRVDPLGFGCGTKLPHNITSLLGVMNGAASDLLPGLPWQMVEVHEPMRLLLVIESTPAALQRVVANNPAIARLVQGQWVQVATLDPEIGGVNLMRVDGFAPYTPTASELPTVAASADWCRGWRGNLGFASVQPEQANSPPPSPQPFTDRTRTHGD